jgi:hypothetical protein
MQRLFRSTTADCDFVEGAFQEFLHLPLRSGGGSPLAPACIKRRHIEAEGVDDLSLLVPDGVALAIRGVLREQQLEFDQGADGITDRPLG